MRKIKDVLRLKLDAHLSHERIAASLGLSKGVVSKYVTLAAAAQLDWQTIQEMNEAELQRRLLPAPPRVSFKQSSTAKALADTLLSWIEPIVRMWRLSKTNGITEGFHNKMEMISRRAYGFRNFENYRIRVLAHCGWNGLINRVW